MAELTKEQLVYLLYAKAYAKARESGTLTKSDLKKNLPDECKEKAEKSYSDLKEQGLIELKDKQGKSVIKDGRFSVTDKGSRVLAINLLTTEYDFTSSTKSKPLATALTCLMAHIKETAEAHPQARLSELFGEMTYEDFQKRFKALYFEERRKQELRGAVAIYSQTLLEKFVEQNSISQNTINQYFDLLKTNRKIFTVIEKEHELIEWAE